MPEAGDSTAAPKQYFAANVVLLALTMLALTIWFDRHLAGWVRQTLLLGSGVTILGAWGIVQGWIRWGIGKEMTERFRTLLSTSRATKLWALVVVPLLLVLYLGTSSLHFSLRATEQELVFDLYEGDRLVERGITLGPEQRQVTRPFFAHFRPSKLRIHVTSPPTYRDSEIPLGLASALPVPLPPEQREFHLLRFIPARGLFAALPRPGEQTQSRYELQLRRISPAPDLWQPVDLRFQTIYAGAPNEELAWMVRALPDDFRPAAERYLDRFDTPQAARERFHRLWSVIGFYPTAEFRPGDVIAVEVRAQDRPAPLLARTLTVGSARVQDVFLEVQ